MKSTKKTSRKKLEEQHHDAWTLLDFFPYHLSYTAELMGMVQSRLIHEETGLTMSEWRVMAVIGSFHPISTRTVVSYTTMNKVAASRAVTSLVDRGYLTRNVDEGDNRLLRLEFSAKGQRLFKQVTELASQWSDSLLASMSKDEIRSLKLLLAKVRKRLQEVSPEDWRINEAQLFGKI